MVRGMSARVPVSWKRPQKNWLEPGGIYPSGEPPFDPFPTVSDIIAANFCPVAILHRLLHGIDRNPALVVPREIAYVEGAGDLYHRFIAYLKSSVMSGRLHNLNSGIIRREFLRFGREITGLEEVWRRYLEPWTNRKLEELNSITREERILFEVTVADLYVPLHYEGSRYTYPLLGRIDEIDLNRRLIIERTTEGGPNDESPPEWDERQLWLLWKTLSSIGPSRYPEELKSVNFNDFRLMVETPFQEFDIDKQNPRFEEEAHDAYAWIRDLTRQSRSMIEAYRNRRCDREPGIECSFMYRYSGCRRRLFTYPLARPRMQRELRDLYRSLLWELMWNYDLFQYKLLLLPITDLEQEGLAARARVTSFPEQNLIELEVAREEEVRPILVHIGDAGRCELMFGAASIGQRVEARPIESYEPHGNRLILRTEGSYIPMSTNTLILPSITLLESRPWFLIKLIQGHTFMFEHIGRENPNNAREDSFVQLIEGLFGSRVLRRERS